MSYLKPVESVWPAVRTAPGTAGGWSRVGLADSIQANLLTLLTETEAQGGQASGCEGNEKSQALGLRPGFDSPLGPKLGVLGQLLNPFQPLFLIHSDNRYKDRMKQGT